jgi:hypothetical protein
MKYSEKVSLERLNRSREHAVNGLKHLSVLRKIVQDAEYLRILDFIQDEILLILEKANEAESSLLELSAEDT